MANLSKRQREILETIEAECAPRSLDFDSDPTVCPAYLGAGRYQGYFTYESEFKKFFDNLVDRGFIRIEKRCFAYITEKGIEAVGVKNDQ